MRRPNDFYETHEVMVDDLIKHVPGIRGTLFECCSGKGAITQALRKHFPTFPIWTNDINIELPAAFHFDAKKLKEWERFKYAGNEAPDWVITNPPFSDAFPILIHAYDTAKVGVAFLLRLSFLEPTYDRQDWLHEHPPTKLIILPRYSFTGDGKTDSVTAAWMVWKKDKPWQESSVVITKKGHR